MSKDLVGLEIRYNHILGSVLLDNYRISPVKWNDIPNGKYMLHMVNKKDILSALGVDKQITNLETKLAESQEELKQYKYSYENAMVLDYTTRKWRKIGDIQQENEQLKQQLVTMEKALENAIVPKFKKGQEVWFIYDENDDYNYTILNKKVMAFTYNNYEGDLFEYAMSDDGTRDTIWYGYIEDRYVFATKEEALAKLKEMIKSE